MEMEEVTTVKAGAEPRGLERSLFKSVVQVLALLPDSRLFRSDSWTFSTILRSRGLKPCFVYVKEEDLRTLLSVMSVLILVFVPLARRFSGSGSETDLQEPVPTVFFDKSAKSRNPGVARGSLVSGGVSRAARGLSTCSQSLLTG